MKRSFIFLLLMLCANSLLWAATPVKVTMRNSGYTMGDLIHMRVEIALPKAQIDTESLPLEGRVTSWLDLRELALSEQNMTTVLDLTWQIFGTVEYSQLLKLPEIPIKTVGKTSQTILIPAQVIYYSSVLPKTIETEQPRANLPPVAFDETTPKHLAILFAVCTLLFGVVLLWVKDKLSWLPYQPGPMTKLARRFRQTSDTHLTTQQIREIHQALNTTAKHSLYPHTMHQLFDTAPYLSEDQKRITQFFEDAWQIIYGRSGQAIALNSVLPWINRAALAERFFLKSKK